MSGEPIPITLDFDPAADELVTLSPLVRRIVAPNAGPMTFKGTNTYVVGHGKVAVIDPGPDSPQHVAAILAALAGETIAWILVTHTHHDHSPGARLLKAATNAPIIGCAPHHYFRPPRDEEAASAQASNDLDYTPDRVLAEGDRVDGHGFTLKAVATPGHTMNHLAFALCEERALFSGDHVMAWSTTIVSPPSGSMRAYMDSLAKLRERGDAIYWPGHGGPVNDPSRFVRALQHHRHQREHAILSRLRAGDQRIQAIVAAVYERIDPRLAKAAELSVLAHLEDLCARGRVHADRQPCIDALYTLPD